MDRLWETVGTEEINNWQPWHKLSPIDNPPTRTGCMFLRQGGLLYLPGTGLYRGIYRLTARTAGTVEIPVTLTVWVLGLPLVPTLQTAFGSWYHRKQENSMPSPSTRRGFLGHAGKFCIAATAASLCCRHLQAAAGPTSLCTAVRDGMLRYTGEKDSWSALKLIGAEGVEVDVHEDLTLPAFRHVAGKYSLATDAGVEQLRKDAATAGRRITAFCLRNHFKERPEVEITLCTRVARIAQALGVPAIRLDVVPKQLARPEFLSLAIRTLGKVMAASEATGVAFAVENHGNTTNDPAFLQPLFAGVGSRRLGLTLDTGNFYWFGNPLSKVYELYEAFAPRLPHAYQEHSLSGRVAREATPHRLEIRRLRVCDRSRRHRLCTRGGDPPQGGLQERSVHRERVSRQAFAGPDPSKRSPASCSSCSVCGAGLKAVSRARYDAPAA